MWFKVLMLSFIRSHCCGCYWILFSTYKLCKGLRSCWDGHVGVFVFVSCLDVVHFFVDMFAFFVRGFLFYC